MGLAAAGVAIGAGGLALNVANSMSGPSGGSSGPGSGGSAPSNIYVPSTSGQQGQDQNFQTQQSYITGQSPWASLSPDYAAIYQGLYNNSYASGYQGASGTAGDTSGQYGGMASNAGQELYGLSNAFLPLAGGLYNNVANNPLYGGALQGTAAGADALSSVGQGATGQASEIGGANIGALGALGSQYQATTNNPFNSQMLGSAAVGGQLLQGQALQDYGNAQSLMPQAQMAAQNNNANASGLVPAAQQQYGTLNQAAGSVLNTAFDPQSQLYNKLFQQNTDQTRAGLEARGLDTSATGQGIEDDSNQNFNLAWQNAQLGRQTAGLSAAQGATGQALTGLEGAGSTAAGLYSQGLSGLQGGATTESALGTNAGVNYAAGGALPGQTYAGIQNTNQGALNNYLSGIGAIGQNAAGANTLGATGANQITYAAQSPYNLSTAQNNAALSAYGSLGNATLTYGGLYGAGANLGNQAVNFQQNAGALPYNASQTIYGNQGTAANNYQNSYLAAMTPYQQSLQNSLQYLGYGVNSGNAYTNAARGSWQQGQQANQAFGAGIQGLTNSLVGNQSNNGGLLGQASNLYNNWNSSGSSGGGTSGYNPMGDLSNYPSYTPVTTTNLPAPVGGP